MPNFGVVIHNNNMANIVTGFKIAAKVNSPLKRSLDIQKPLATDQNYLSIKSKYSFLETGGAYGSKLEPTPI